MPPQPRAIGTSYAASGPQTCSVYSGATGAAGTSNLGRGEPQILDRIEDKLKAMEERQRRYDRTFTAEKKRRTRKETELGNQVVEIQSQLQQNQESTREDLFDIKNKIEDLRTCLTSLKSSQTENNQQNREYYQRAEERFQRLDQQFSTVFQLFLIESATPANHPGPMPDMGQTASYDPQTMPSSSPHIVNNGVTQPVSQPNLHSTNMESMAQPNSQPQHSSQSNPGPPVPGHVTETPEAAQPTSSGSPFDGVSTSSHIQSSMGDDVFGFESPDTMQNFIDNKWKQEGDHL
ncbi:hypothetical protein AAP_05695 [Ascosphaera apis ARSEF 7405]|uniref:Uncharacterized protein n=1 Tax=Ascosphaera apis ARSEF 7405 TaxID=392613 RepID=A0A167VBT2_9EURO|nr:hypothetical protein AAP_05695 [Ascosphaera apis ARSEF 7405]